VVTQDGRIGGLPCRLIAYLEPCHSLQAVSNGQGGAKRPQTPEPQKVEVAGEEEKAGAPVPMAPPPPQQARYFACFASDSRMFVTAIQASGD
jgi:hypothetical protein